MRFLRSIVKQSIKKYRLVRKSVVLAGIPMSSFAYSTSDDALTNILTSAVNYAQSGPARALCVLAIAGAGYLWIGKGVLPKSYAIAIICGSGFIFGAGFIGANVLGLQG